MRKIISALLFAICFTASAQQYFPFPTDSAIWQGSFSAITWMCPSVPPHGYQYYTCGDTMINSTVYHKICGIGWTADANCFGVPSGYIGCIREDSSRHVYFRSPIYTNDTNALLYDFNVQVGDTLKTLNNWCQETVVLIDSVLIGSSYRKQYHMSGDFMCGNTQRVIIEGIGSSSGLFDEFGQYEARHDLNCFSHNGQGLYPNSSASCPLMTVGIDPLPVQPVWNVAPNPAISGVAISSSVIGENSQYRIVIWNLTGQQVAEQKTISANGVLSIERNDLPEGTYFAEILTGQQSLTRVKIIFL